MPEYLYHCPVHGDFPVSFPMGAAPPTVLCRICKRESRRTYQAVSVQYHSDGFSQSLPDRPDERLDSEIKRSMDFDATGVSWEETEGQQAQRLADGQVPKKTFRLPE